MLTLLYSVHARMRMRIGKSMGDLRELRSYLLSEKNVCNVLILTLQR